MFLIGVEVFVVGVNPQFIIEFKVFERKRWKKERLFWRVIWNYVIKLDGYEVEVLYGHMIWNHIIKSDWYKVEDLCWNAIWIS